MRKIVIANSAAQLTSANDRPANRAITAMARPHTISVRPTVPMVRVSGSAIPATSAPLASVHDSPHSICVATSGRKSVTRLVAIIAVPMRTCETTSDHFRLIVSATTPAGTSNTIGRLGHAAEIAAAVLWLCSPASSFVIGVALPVDGGYTAR